MHVPYRPPVLVVFLLLLAACSQERTGTNPERGLATAQSSVARAARVLLLTQADPFDATTKDRISGEYHQRDTLLVPPDLLPQNKWLMFEGPVLENDRVAYRYYADSRHRFDVFGKRVVDMVMDTVGWNYHEVMNWGSDILKVGNSLGIGSPGVLYRDSVYAFSDYVGKQLTVVEEASGAAVLRTDFTDLHFGDEVLDLTQYWRLRPGRYDAEVELVVNGGRLPEGARFVTGIVRHLPTAETGRTDGVFYVANWGNQSFHGEGMGMAVLADTTYAPGYRDGNLNHLMIFEDAPDRVRYRHLVSWEKDRSGVTDQADFLRLVRAAADY